MSSHVAAYTEAAAAAFFRTNVRLVSSVCREVNLEDFENRLHKSTAMRAYLETTRAIEPLIAVAALMARG